MLFCGHDSGPGAFWRTSKASFWQRLLRRRPSAAIPPAPADAFRAGFIYGLVTGQSIEETMRTATAVAALKCRELGARAGLPTLEELRFS
jgi:hypothetical protein